ncbi:related to oxidoreductase, short chain dehydrogenase/reductase family [Armillaria ostoyae]|uniref:Related to oxidoreductase, short chain dehydrogenase/reductase family n=1 Tax=Armillaria ostoyae TaxID=47428 RepID=A0A284RZA9_ARMOS|nr:related to oxidoreductase, short chain dehydrogenase/reductase family [Armillaria ostoyae]
MANTPIAVIAGLGSGSGTGAAAARLLAKEGYAVALVARGADSVKALSDEINAAGGTAEPFPISSYSTTDINTAYAQIRAHYQGQPIRVALYNATHDVWKPFLDVTPEDVRGVIQTNLEGAFAFSKNVIRAFQANQVDEKGKRGSLIFTGATASIRGNVTTSAFSAGKHALRALSQSLAKEFGKQNIHVSHAIIDGGILTNSARKRRNDREWEQNEDVRLSPDGIAESYLHLIKQPRSAWTWELDLRPAHEKW